MSLSRRRFLAGALASAPAASLLSFAADLLAADPQGLDLGPREPFDFDRLTRMARERAAAPYAAVASPHADLLERIDYDAYQAIRFRPERALWAGGDGPYPVQLFHPGRYFKLPVRIHVAKDGEAREVRYRRQLFDMPPGHVAAGLPDDVGFAGFRVMGRDGRPDWLAFLGAAYFRSSGQLEQYGLSARGLAIDTAMPTPEEFPRFESFWLSPATDRPDGLVIHALMDGPSLAGAYRIEAVKETGVVTTVTCRLFARRAVARMGVAPLTSMFWYSETDRPRRMDWRPEIHDSDGLAVWTGAGERIWRPLNNPPRVQTSSFVDADPKGFGLAQRDRVFANYEDDGVFYDRRATVWVEPLEGWGRGSVQLVEIPTDDEIHDNIVAYWVPEEPVEAGSEWTFSYRLHWLADEPFPGPVARTVATRLGRGGVPGQPRPSGFVKVAVDFSGGPLEGLVKADAVKPVIRASRGKVDGAYALQVVGTKRWRAIFDVAAEGAEPVDLRLYLRLGDRTLSETWLYQLWPEA